MLDSDRIGQSSGECAENAAIAMSVWRGRNAKNAHPPPTQTYPCRNYSHHAHQTEPSDMGGTGVIDEFLEIFTRYIDSGFGLLHGEVAFIATTLTASGIIQTEALPKSCSVVFTLSTKCCP